MKTIAIIALLMAPVFTVSLAKNEKFLAETDTEADGEWYYNYGSSNCDDYDEKYESLDALKKHYGLRCAWPTTCKKPGKKGPKGDTGD